MRRSSATAPEPHLFHTNARVAQFPHRMVYLILFPLLEYGSNSRAVLWQSSFCFGTE